MRQSVKQFMDRVTERVGGRERVIDIGLSCSAFIFKSDRALDMLISRMAAAGMSEDDMVAALAASRARHQRMLLITALVLLAVGFAIREVFGETTMGRIGSGVMFLGLVVTAVRIKRSDKPSPMSMQSISEVFRKK
ncbi:MAG: hypothetical protein H7293_17690 [Candidatus Saccharibacteria bacterium]|nr:hypothetical protein [Rhodoferax sp.]